MAFHSGPPAPASRGDELRFAPEIPARPSQAACPDKPVFPLDVLVPIVDHIQETSPSSISNVKLVNWEMYQIATYRQHKSLEFIFRQDQAADMCVELPRIQDHGLLPAVRYLTISLPVFENLVTPRAFRLVCREGVAILNRLMPQMTGLKVLCWKGVIPPVILESLSQFSSLQLDVQCRALGHREAKPFLSRLVGICQLRSLEITQCYGDPQGLCDLTRLLKKILLGCPNLRRLNFNLYLGGELELWELNSLSEYRGLDMAAHERPPALEEFTVRAFPWNWDEHRGWADNWDWSQLRKFVGPWSFATLIAHKLFKIEEIVITDIDLERGIACRFLRLLPKSPVRVAFSTARDAVLKELVASLCEHGASLQSLQLHSYENKTSDWLEEAQILASRLGQIREVCPNLENLELDVPRSSEWPYAILDDLAWFPNLRHLTIWFELANANKPPIKPYVVLSEVSPMFDYIWQRQGPKRLETLTIHSGAHTRMGNHFSAKKELVWRDRNSISFVCALSERDDEAARGQTTTSCTQLNRRNNIQLALKDGEPVVPTRYRGLTGNEQTDGSYFNFLDENLRRLFSLARHGPNTSRAHQP